jgi:hypothetical protein
MTLDEVIHPLLHPTVLPPHPKEKPKRAISDDQMDAYREEESMAGTEDE